MTKKAKMFRAAAVIAALIFAFYLVSTQTTAFCSEDEKNCVEMARNFKNHLKDPDSMILTSDVLYAKFENGEEVWCFSANCKNSFGAYTGSQEVEAVGKNGTSLAFAGQGDEYFMQFKEIIEEAELQEEKMFEHNRFNGRKVARIVNCKYKNNK